MKFTRTCCLATGFLLLPFSAFAEIQAGTLTQVQGEVNIFSHPGKTMQGPAPHALFEGEYYSVQSAKVGDKVDEGNIIRTAPEGKARIVFENGDQYNIGNGTAFRVFWNNAAPAAPSNANLMYGKIRGVIAKSEGKRHLTVKTKTAVMGVRGTDFFIYDGGENGTEVSVLRGEVEVQPLAAGANKALAKAGFLADVAPPSRAGSSAKVSLRKLSQQDLGVVKSASHLKTESSNEEIKRLEEKSVAAVRKDIEAYTPKLATADPVQNSDSSEVINSFVVDQFLTTAAKSSAQSRLHRGEAEDVEGGYGKYFGK